MEQYSRMQLANLGDRLRELRIQRGYSSAEKFAYDLGMNRVQYGRYENGANISFATLVMVIKFLKMSIAEFFAEGFDDRPAQQ